MRSVIGWNDSVRSKISFFVTVFFDDDNTSFLSFLAVDVKYLDVFGLVGIFVADLRVLETLLLELATMLLVLVMMLNKSANVMILLRVWV